MRMRWAARGLAELGLVAIYEFQGESVKATLFYPDPTGGPVLTDICVTERGWNYLRGPAEEG